MLTEIRRNHFDGHMSIISKTDDSDSHNKNPYEHGNEDLTKPSVTSFVQKDGMLCMRRDTENNLVKDWIVRIFEKNNPILSTSPRMTYGDIPHPSQPAYGYHYTAVVSPKDSKGLTTLGAEHWSNILVGVQNRMIWLYEQKNIVYVGVYGNHGKAAGSDNAIPHLNMIGLAVIPPNIEREIQALTKILEERDECAMCQLISTETKGPRRVHETDGFFAFCPWSSRHDHEFWIAPKKHSTMFTKITQKEIKDLAGMMRITLGGLSRHLNDPACNIVFHFSPETKKRKHIHWHVEVYPIETVWSGLERGYGIFVNSLSPETAAAKLAKACRNEIASIEGII